MAVQFTYDGDPASKPTDAVRWFCGDTNKKRPLLDDREILFAIANEGNSRLAAATCCDSIAAKFSSIPDIRVGDVSKAFGKVADQFRAQAKKLREEACKRAGVSFPATTVAGKQTLVDDTALTRPQFSLGLTDNPFTVQLNREFARFPGSFSGF